MKRLVVPLVAALAIAGCGGSHHNKIPYKTAPRPPLPAGVKPPSCGSSNNHSMGQCLPKRSGTVAPQLVHLPNGARCIDLSNNDPILGLAAWRTIRAHGFTCAQFKVSEGTGFVDRTAKSMASAAKAAGLHVGGYGFQHVCWDSAVSEARLFVAYEKADGLLGPGTINPTADTEYGSGSCGGRSWLATWHSTVHSLTGRDTDTYTGAWFWNPNLGSYWIGKYAWISGYGVSWPFTPSGHSHVDIWQNSDNTFNGVNRADASVVVGVPFASYVHAAPIHSLPVCFHKRESKATCSAARAKLVRYQRAVSSSAGAYKARSCPLFVQRVAWFGNAIKRQPRSPKTASRKRALAASQKAYKARSCSTFASRVGLYSSLIKQVESSN